MTPSRPGRVLARVAVLAVFAAAIVAFVALGGARYLTLDRAKESRRGGRKSTGFRLPTRTPRCKHSSSAAKVARGR